MRNLIGWALVAVPLLLLAGRESVRAPTTPTPNLTTPVPPLAAAAGGEAGESRGKKGRPPNAANEDKWPDVVAFMKANSAKKWAAYEKLPEAAQLKLRAKLIAQYNELNSLANNEKLHKIELERVKIEDDIFGALSQQKRVHPQGPYSPEYLAAVGRFVDNRMQERKARLEILAAVVNHDEAVKKDPAGFKTLVLERAKIIERNGLGAVPGGRRRLTGQPATAESEEEVIHPTSEK